MDTREALNVLEMFLHKQCSLKRTEFAYDQTTVYEAVSMATDALEASQWIPVSERLPEKTGHYLCSFKKPHRIDNIFVDLAYWTGGRWYGYLANEIVAWQPLPRSYEVR